MPQDLLALSDLEPPMGDLFTHARFDRGRAVWTSPLPAEQGMAKKRIIHQRVVRLPGAARLLRLGVRRGQGYHKCGSRQDLDWVVGLRVLGWRGGRWQELCRRDDLKAPRAGATQWIELGGVEVAGVIIELRRSGIDGGWTPWNLVMSAFVLEGELVAGLPPRCERVLAIDRVDLRRLPRGVSAQVVDGAVRYRTRDFEVGFTLNRPGFSFLGLHVEDPANAGTNLVASRPPQFPQGPQWHPVAAAPVIAPTVRCALEGRTVVRGATVRYTFKAGGQAYDLTWRVSAAGLRLEAVRTAAKTEYGWHSAAWCIGLRNSASPAHVLGQLIPDGESGAVALPALLVLPKYGAWRVAADTPDGWGRSDCFRHQDLNTLELKVGEERTAEGVYRLPAGTHRATFTLEPARPASRLRRGAPAVVRRALGRTQWTALTLRADTATLSNNGASMHCPICMDTWAAVTRPMGDVLPGLPATEFLRLSLERWLTGGPGYAAGKLIQDGKAHDADDEYLMTGASALRGLGDYLRAGATAAWYREFRPWILEKLQAARGRDLDQDGLIESAYRTGVSGTNQWSTCWFDVISFGWKDAFANAILYGALRSLAAGLERLSETDVARTLTRWADLLHNNYRQTFWNPATGWLGGWRCREGKLHDYAFLPVNGAAVAAGLVEGEEAKAMLLRLLAEAKRVGMPDPALGLPGSLWPIPDYDLADIMQGYPLGYYQNGGRTHSQTRHLVMGLYRCGLQAEADWLLERLCVGFAEARVFGGNQSGVDWRYWDDRPCGYEGLLTDQFGVLEAIYARWGGRTKERAGRPD
ncbi:hypothetical protein [Opitutus sp. ER46]|uniref:hypothetical protein n=1 Tax=Opitutus sp. ER46 TaxID=2161864 RepID=UPI000D30FA17|nr:hypothetical protein [Opitutus sp. ER46]PTX94463.1 hypothetical protein DB354_12015 [Opitutus sp. ER46]